MHVCNQTFVFILPLLCQSAANAIESFGEFPFLDIALSVMVFNVKLIQSISSRRNLLLAHNTGFQNFVFVEFNFLSGSRVRVPPLSCLEKSVACKLRHLYCEKVEQVLTRLVYIQSEVKLSQNYKSPTVHCYAFIHYILTISDYLSCTSFPASR